MTGSPGAPGLSVAEMSAATGVTPHTLRYYERAGLIAPVSRSVGNQRRYSAEDIEWVGFLLRLRETGMPIAGMRDYADLRARGTTTLHARLAMLEAHQHQLEQQIAALRDHQAALSRKIAHYRDEIGNTPADHTNEEGTS